jgi:hypothetical protein
VLTQRPGFVNGRLYIIFLAATLGVISAGLAERRAAETSTVAATDQSETSGSFLVVDWVGVAGAFKSPVQSPPANKSTWSSLGSALRSVTRQPMVPAVAFRAEELEPSGCWEVCYDEPVELEAAGVEAVEGCPVELFDEVALQSFL